MMMLIPQISKFATAASLAFFPFDVSKILALNLGETNSDQIIAGASAGFGPFMTTVHGAPHELETSTCVLLGLSGREQSVLCYY